MAVERRHQFGVGKFSSAGTEDYNHFYRANVLYDPFTNGGTLVRTLSWPKVAFIWEETGATSPPWEQWTQAEYTWIAYYSVDGTIPPPSLISPYSGNCVLRSSLTPAVYPSPTVAGAYQLLLTCEAQGVQSKRMHKPQDPELTAALITGLWTNDYYIQPSAWPTFSIAGGSNDYTIWEKNV